MSIVVIQIILICNLIILCLITAGGVARICNMLDGIMHFINLYNQTSIKGIDDQLLDIKKILAKKFDMYLTFKNGRNCWEIYEKDKEEVDSLKNDFPNGVTTTPNTFKSDLPDIVMKVKDKE